MTPKRQILVVEDNRLNREMLVEILSEQYFILEAENGLEALDILRQHSINIALVLLDIMMPVMDGYTFLDKLKEYPELSLIPVIVMTQSNSIQDEVAALSHGATDFVPKPYHPEVVLHRVASIINLRETAAMANELKYDRLTGLYSKDFFYRMVRDHLSEDQNQEYSIICSNIENFKLINDRLGIQQGDRLLKELANAIVLAAGDSGFCGRFSADRFLCFQKKEKELRDRSIFEQGGFEVSSILKNTVIRWGIYEITDRTIPVELMCDRAVMAVDSIKGKYDKYYAVYDESLRSQKLWEQTITNAMADALNEEQFVVYYQPKYALEKGGMVGAEALVRWIHPDWGFVSPGDFIPLFEKNGFIYQLDQYIWRHVCMQIKEWKEKGYPVLPISVNVSRADLYHVDLPEVLLELTECYGIEQRELHLEITESAYTENPVQITSAVELLRKKGFVIEMDDFGSGYSSLNMFSQMKMDILKLDMKFVQNETSKPINQSILSDVINMAHRMCLKVIAEGVEHKAQVDRLQEIGCDYVQGYFFSKPLPSAEFELLLQKNSMNPVALPEQMAIRNILTILVADEDEAYRKKVCSVFGQEYQVIEAADTAEMLALLKTQGEEGIAAVILSSTLEQNGAAVVLKEMRQNSACWNIPVLATLPTPDVNRKEQMAFIMETDDFLCKCHPTFDLRRRIEHLISIVELKKKEKLLLYEANCDPLTGLLNRRGLESAINVLHSADFPVAVCMFDLDNLKMINDTFGHSAGDQAIQAFAELLRRKTRSGDILCRYGGDEFVLVLMNVTDSAAIIKRIESICISYKQDFADGAVKASCSAGIVLCKPDEKPSAMTFEHADQALYKAKQDKSIWCQWQADR